MRKKEEGTYDDRVLVRQAVCVAEVKQANGK